MSHEQGPRPHRRHPVHGIQYVEGQPTIIFDTLCLKPRRSVLACHAFHRTFLEVASTATAWLMGRYVLMPDHIHFFAGDVGNEIPYENWVKYLKSQLTKRYKREGEANREGEAPAEPEAGTRRTARQEPRPPITRSDFRWLTDHWDCRIRNGGVYEEKWQYARNNPVRAGLVANPDDWPYQGEVFELRWH